MKSFRRHNKKSSLKIVKISAKLQVTTNKIVDNYIPRIEEIFPATLQNTGRLFNSHRIPKVPIVF